MCIKGGICPLSRFDIVKRGLPFTVVIDYMHMALEGITKRLLHVGNLVG